MCAPTQVPAAAPLPSDGGLLVMQIPPVTWREAVEASFSQSFSAYCNMYAPCKSPSCRKGLKAPSTPSLLSSAWGWGPCSGTAPPEVSPLLCPHHSPVLLHTWLRMKHTCSSVQLQLLSFRWCAVLLSPSPWTVLRLSTCPVPQDLSGLCCCSHQDSQNLRCGKGYRRPQSSLPAAAHQAAP